MQYLDIRNGSYRSSPVKVSLLSRLVPSLNFYPRFFKVVLNAASKAKSGRYPDEEWGMDSLRVLRLLENTGLLFSVDGLENLEDLAGPCVLVGNHMSIMETLILPVIVLPYTKVTFVVKDSLLAYPVFKHVMISRNPVAVTRTNPRQDLKTVMGEGAERLDSGISIIVFPQTTRSTEFDPLQFGSIGIKLAKKADVPVVPFALKTDAWQNGTFSKDLGRIFPQVPVRIAFGKPLQISGKGNEEHQQVVTFIQSMLSQWQ
ncbi:MAG: lysophospholipid acyltransferase family protein [Desulfopila sp.]|jgi:1-acyl-sn-glycerol-3-phosphate acyltransferase|nr:lysophospholipid acyltransferase family protein [Desulfopila sp.]